MMSGHGHGYGYGLRPQDAGGAPSGPGMPELGGYIVGMDASSFVDPGGGAHRTCTSTPVENLAGESIILAPNFDPASLPVLHTGDWLRDNPVSTIPAPGTFDWISVNRNSKDTSLASKTSWEHTWGTSVATTGRTIVIGLYITSAENVWYSPYFASAGQASSRTAMNSVSGRIDCVTPNATKILLVASDAVWTRDAWHMWAFGQDTDVFWSSIDGVESTYSTSPVGLGGAFTMLRGPWGTQPDGGFACLHAWDTYHTLAEMRPTLAYLAARHDLPYTP